VFRRAGRGRPLEGGRRGRGGRRGGADRELSGPARGLDGGGAPRGREHGAHPPCARKRSGSPATGCPPRGGVRTALLRSPPQGSKVAYAPSLRSGSPTRGPFHVRVLAPLLRTFSCSSNDFSHNGCTRLLFPAHCLGTLFVTHLLTQGAHAGRGRSRQQFLRDLRAQDPNPHVLAETVGTALDESTQVPPQP